ncbi:Small-conductance mechanosensitive channel [Thermoplasmatales archaeon BRNA1]|nr:Small-conductance mechanosensitive channel [Thermoplasmatales archaeon BRNA1]
MFKGRAKYIAGALAVLALLMLAAVPFGSDDSSAINEHIGSTDVRYVYDENTKITVPAGEATTFVLVIYNDNVSSGATVTICASCDGNIKVDPMNSGLITVDKESFQSVTLTLDADHYAPTGDYSLDIRITDLTDAGEPYAEFSVVFHVSSNLTSEKYNKFLGWFPNELDGALGSVWFTAAVSFVGLLLIGYAAMFIAVPVCSRIVMKKDDPQRKVLKKLLYRLCQVIVWLWVVGQVFRILGTSEEIIDLINRLFYLAYIVVGVVVGWQLYKLIIDTVVRRLVVRADEYDIDRKTDFESFRPLFLYIGEIIIAIVATMLIMSLLGFNLTAIITSAGLVSLGISMGAQDVLKQFFSGLEILATRPFKKGDLITVGTDTTIYRVRRVNVMNTFLENWDNTDVSIMPNSLITTNKIQNITRETLVTKVYITVDVAYGSDVNLVRTLMQQAANENHHVINDGSVTRPYTRLEAFGESNLNVKMGFYVDNFSSKWAISGQIRQSIIEKFAANNVSIDYQQIVIHEGEPRTRDEAAKDPEGSIDE